MHAKFAVCVCVCVRQKFSVCNKILKIKTQPKSSHSPAPFSLIKVSISGRYTHAHSTNLGKTRIFICQSFASWVWSFCVHTF